MAAPAEQPGAGRRSRSLPGSSVAASHPSGWSRRHWTSRVLHNVGEAASHSGAGILAGALVVVWLGVGLLVRFPIWWSTVLYSGAASVTFVMVFVIQHTNERQTAAMQRKLDELIRSSTLANDGLIAVEEASDGQLQTLADHSVAEGELKRE